MPEEFTTPQSIAEEVTNFLRRQLLMGKRFPPGSFIREAEVADELHISRSPVREALKTLESHGVVKTLPRRGAVVLDYSREEMDEIYDVRILLEMKIYSHIVEAGLLTDEHYEWLMACMGRFCEVNRVFEESHEKGQLQFFDIDSEFHFYIHDMAQLPWTAELLKKTYSRLYQFRIRRIGKEDLDRLVKFHRAIVDNLRSGDLKALKNIRIESYLVGKAYN